ncbi:MAG: YlbF family regulator [Firmicutes bacterium]|nr:YlbF family regulator [Bacillota bacterium]
MINKDTYGDMAQSMAQQKNKAGKKLGNKQMIRRQAAVLADMLAASTEYLQYIEAKKSLMAHKEQMAILNELRQQQFNLRFVAMMGENTEEESADFESAYAEITKEPVINDYLYAEGRLYRLISEIQDVFCSKLEVGEEILMYEESSGILN